jgi:hypothetical protein
VQVIIAEKPLEYAYGFLRFVLFQQQDAVEQFFLFKKQ